MSEDTEYVAFLGARRVASGGARELLPVLKQRFDKDPAELVLVFELQTGRQVDFDLSGTLGEVIERALPTRPRGPGRPKLGVTSREVSLFPRHWDWLERQSHGTSGALRRLVEQAIRNQSGADRAQEVRAALSRVLSSLAGDRPNYEEATRALFAGDTARFEALIARWPKDIVEHARAQMQHAEAESSRMA
jgi:uncharacterized protein